MNTTPKETNKNICACDNTIHITGGETCLRMKRIKIVCKCKRTLHDFTQEEVYENGMFKGDLYKCKNCDREHLCQQNTVTAGRCSHSTEFNLNCEPK